MLGVGSVIRSYVNHRDEKLDRDVFADEACQILSLPRLVANHRGGVIVADLDNRGNSILVFKRRIIRIPRILVDQDIQAWNITPREARILVQMAWPLWQDENPSSRLALRFFARRRSRSVLCVSDECLFTVL